MSTAQTNPRDLATRLLSLTRQLVPIPPEIVDLNAPLDVEFMKLGVQPSELDDALQVLAYQLNFDLSIIGDLKPMSIQQIARYVAIFEVDS